MRDGVYPLSDSGRLGLRKGRPHGHHTGEAFDFGDGELQVDKIAAGRALLVADERMAGRA